MPAHKQKCPRGQAGQFRKIPGLGKTWASLSGPLRRKPRTHHIDAGDLVAFRRFTGVLADHTRCPGMSEQRGLALGRKKW